MKKLWISIGMALGLLAAPAIATAQDGTRTPVNKYSISSAVKTFTDLKTLTPNETENGVKYKFELGANLAEAANLDDIFYVSNDEATAAEAASFKEVTMTTNAATDATERTQKAIPLSVLGLTDFNFLGKPVKGFAVAAAGGILFAGDDMNVSCQGGTPKNAQISGAVYKDFARVYACDDNWENTTASKSANAPVIIAGGTDATQGAFIWAQFDVTFGDMNWLFQIRCYANGKTEYILGNDLEHSKTEEYYFCPALVQDGEVDGGVITLGTGGYANDAHCWDALQRNPSENTVDDGCILLDADCGPETGRTITVVPPIEAAAFSMANPTMTFSSLNGSLTVDPAQAPAIALSEGVHTLCITMTTAANKDFAYYGMEVNAEPTTAIKNDWNQVVYVGKPTDMSQTANLPLAVSQLKANTEYYIHVFPCYYTPGATRPYYYGGQKPLVSFGPYKTLESPSVKDIQVAIADGQAQLTFQPATGYSTMLVQSDKPTAPAVSGKLQQGDGLGTDGADGTVIGVWDATTTSYNLPLEAGQGCYLHFYCVENAGTDNALYGEAVSTTAYRPAETLPFTWSFNANQVPSTPTALPLLPPGWQHDASSTFEGAKYFVVYNSGTDAVGYGLKACPSTANTVSVITPSFIPNIPKVEVVFTSFYSYYTPVDGDWIRIECRKDGGDWQEVKTFTHSDWGAADYASTYPLSIVVEDAKDKVIDLRYTMNIMSGWTSHYIKSVEVKESNPCRKPTDLTIAADATTDQAVKLSWNAIAEATAFTVAYQEAGTDTPDAWTEKPATEKEMTLDGLNSLTAYRIKVSAACTVEGADYTSPFSDVVTATTYAGAPYHESMDNVYEDPEDWMSDLLSTPADRGVKTYTGKIDGTLSENTGASYTWASGNTIQSLNRKPETAMGVKEEFENGAVLLTPVIHVDREDLYLNVTLTSFSVTKNADYTIKEIVKGAAPKDAGCKLHIAVSNTGSFTTADIVKTLTGDELKLDETVVKIQLEKKGNVQIGLFFDDPTPNWTDPVYYLEVSDLKLAPEGKFTLTAVAEPAEGGTVSGGGEYAATAEVTLRAIANNGYDFVAWKNGETELSTSAIYTFEMPGENVTYTAHFAPHEYNLNLTASPAAGGTVEGAKKYPMGADVTIKATPAQGYVFVAWMNGGTEVSKAAEYTFKMPASDLSYTATFEKPKYELTLAPSSPRAGSVEGAGSYEADADVTIKATANEGYTFVAWMNGETEVSKEAEYTFKMPAQKTHYMALFQADKQEFTLTLNVSPADAGTVEGAGKHEAGTDVTIKATANEGYEFVAWMNGETEVSKEAEYTFKMPAENVTYTATFAKKSANEDVLRANFNLYAKDGRLHIRNLEGMTISSVEVYSLNGQRLNTFTPNSREDLSLAVAAERALVFVRIHTERGAAIYKVYLP